MRRARFRGRPPQGGRDSYSLLCLALSHSSPEFRGALAIPRILIRCHYGLDTKPNKGGGLVCMISLLGRIDFVATVEAQIRIQSSKA